MLQQGSGHSCRALLRWKRVAAITRLWDPKKRDNLPFASMSNATARNQPGQCSAGPDTIDKTVAFLAKRDGIDKVLKVIRYSSKLLLATSALQSSPELAGRLKEFEGSIGTSRKAYRLGKWIADANKLRKNHDSSHHGWLDFVAAGGEGVYYFVEQLTWLVKAGMLHKSHAARFSLISAWAEMVGYAASITLNCLQIHASLDQEHSLQSELDRRKKVGDQQGDEEKLWQKLQGLRLKRLLKTAAVVQDLADSLLALNDIRDSKGVLASPVLLCLCGLLSAAISIQKNWPS